MLSQSQLILDFLKQGIVPLALVNEIKTKFSENNDILKMDDFLIIRRLSNKYKNSYRYHITTKLLQESALISMVYRSDFYIILPVQGDPIIKKFPFIIKLQFYSSKDYYIPVNDQLAHSISVARVLYGKVICYDEQKNINLHARAKNLFYGNFQNIPVIGTIIPFIEGKDLYRAYLCGEIKELPLFKKIKLVLNFLKQLKILHDRGELHGDIKLLNVIYNHHTGQVSLIDLDTTNTSKNIVISTASLGFTAPESYCVGSHRPSNKTLSSDIYSAAGVIGCIFFGPEFAHQCSNEIKVLESLTFDMWRAGFVPYNFDFAKQVIDEIKGPLQNAFTSNFDSFENFRLNIEEENIRIKGLLAIILGYLSEVMCTLKPHPGRADINQTINFFNFVKNSIEQNSEKFSVSGWEKIKETKQVMLPEDDGLKIFS